jgi:hypothetical protein
MVNLKKALSNSCLQVSAKKKLLKFSRRDIMDKNELVADLSRKLKVEGAIAEMAVNQTIAEIASPFVFRKPGEEAGLILDNSCRNNCKEPAAAEAITNPATNVGRLIK